MAATNRETGAATSRTPETQPRPQKITTFLWFDTDAEEAMNFYVSIFKNARIVSVNR